MKGLTMKKQLIFASILAIAMTATTAFAQDKCPCPQNGRPPFEHGKFQPPPYKAKAEQAKADFEKKLKLTDEQKAQAKELRQKGHEQMKPIMEKMKVKKDKIKEIKNSSISEEEKKKAIEPLRKEMFALQKEARDLRIKNMQEFEAILTDKQKKTLEKMKQDGKKNFKKQHKKHAKNFQKPCNCGEKK